MDSRFLRSLTAASWLGTAGTLAGACAGQVDVDNDEPASVAELAVSANRGKPAWTSWSHDNQNSRSQPKEEKLSPKSVAKLAPKWHVDLAGDLSATPVVEGDAVYMTDFGGSIWRLDRETGAVVWSHTATEYTGVPGDSVRVSPAIAGDSLVMGNQGGRAGAGATVFAIDKNTGEKLWAVPADPHPASVITQSPTVFEGKVYVGVSSIEEFYAVGVPGYQCCSFRGSMLALDLVDGHLLWQTPMIDDAAYIQGYRGNAIWGSQPSIDEKRRTVYVATGNNYDIPPAVGECVQNVLDTTPADEAAVRACLGDAKNYFDAIVALDLDSGDVKWAKPVLPFDAFTIACVFLPEVFGDNCPSPSGPDHDFGQAPMPFSVKHGKKARDLVGAGQKSGMFWALDADTGELAWSTKVGPGGHLGGSMWGSATDGKRLYVTNSNSEHLPWTLQGKCAGAGTTTQRAFWSALDPATGAILWQTPDPNDYAPAAATDPVGGIMGAVSVANGVVYGGSLAPRAGDKTMVAMNAESGAIVWSFASGASVVGGASIVDGQVFWGSGYRGGELNVGVTGKTLYAFELKR